MTAPSTLGLKQKCDVESTIRILARYQACHVIYQLNISSMKLRFWLRAVARSENPGGLVVLVGIMCPPWWR